MLGQSEWRHVPANHSPGPTYPTGPGFRSHDFRPLTHSLTQSHPNHANNYIGSAEDVHRDTSYCSPVGEVSIRPRRGLDAMSPQSMSGKQQNI
jgi:hypothetical protein